MLDSAVPLLLLVGLSSAGLSAGISILSASVVPVPNSVTLSVLISSRPNTGLAIPLEAIGAISVLGGLGIYKKENNI